jgi:predicted PurR-regulated permease PerM
MENRTKIDISTSTIIKVAVIILGIWFLFVIREIVILFFLALILVAALSPLVDKIAKFIPRTLAVATLVLVMLAIFVGIGFLIVPPLVAEIKLLAINLPIITSKLGPIYHNLQISLGNYQDTLLNLSSQIGKLTSGIFATTLGFISGIVAFVTILILTFYMLVGKESIGTYVSNFIAEEKRDRVAAISGKISGKMSQWLGGHLFLMLVVGCLDGVALFALGVPYALVLAIWGGLTEMIPYLGPWLGAIPAVLIAFTVSPLAALLVLIAYIIIQQLEATFLAPKIIGKAVGLSPVIVIISLLAGAKLMGLVGVIVAVPVAAIISVLMAEWPEIKNLAKP